MLGHLMNLRHLNIWKVKIWLSQEQKRLSRWNKKHSSLFYKCSLLDIKNRLAKMQRTQPLNILKFCTQHCNFCVKWSQWKLVNTGNHQMSFLEKKELYFGKKYSYYYLYQNYAHRVPSYQSCRYRTSSNLNGDVLVKFNILS